MDGRLIIPELILCLRPVHQDIAVKSFGSLARLFQGRVKVLNGSRVIPRSHLLGSLLAHLPLLGRSHGGNRPERTHGDQTNEKDAYRPGNDRLHHPYPPALPPLCIAARLSRPLVISVSLGPASAVISPSSPICHIHLPRIRASKPAVA